MEMGDKSREHRAGPSDFLSLRERIEVRVSDL